MAPLPKYRGCNLFSFDIYNQEKIFGTTLHVMNSKFDSGDIISQRLFEIDPNHLGYELYLKTVE